jgi:hypothetical protein
MGQGSSTPATTKNYSTSIKNSEYSLVTDSTLLKYIKCNYYTAKEYKDIDKNLLPPQMCKIRKTVNVGNTRITDGKIRDKIFKSVMYDTKTHGDNMNMYQFTMSPSQLKTLEQTINNILITFSNSVIGGKIPGPIYVAYSKILDYDGSYITRYCDKLSGVVVETVDPKNAKNSKKPVKKSVKETEKTKFFKDIVNQLKDANNKSIIDKTIYGRYVWKGNIDLIILIPNMNNLNKIHTNIFDYFINNQITSYLIYSNFMNNIIPNDMSKVPRHLMKNAVKENNFEHDSNNICLFHGCTVTSIEEDIDAILPKFSEEKSTMNANVRSAKVYLPNKCLRTVDFVKNGYNPKGDKVRSKFKFETNVDYTDIVFEMIFCLAIDCMFKNADKENGVANRWYKYMTALNKNPDSIEPDEVCDDHIILHMNSYIYECIKGTPPDKEDEKEDVQLAIKPIKIEKKHYTRWNDDIMKELAKRNTVFPGIQQFIYPFFQVNINRSSVNNSVFYLPWGDKLLANTEFLAEGELKTEVKSHNNVYSLATNQYGQIGIKQNNSFIKWFSDIKFPSGKYGIILTSDCKITVNANNSTVVFITITEKTSFKLPLSLIVFNDGSINVFENGFKPVKLLKNFTVSTSSFVNDINYINKNGLWYYLTAKGGDGTGTGNDDSEFDKDSLRTGSKYAKCKWITDEIEHFIDNKCSDEEVLNEISLTNNTTFSDKESIFYTNAKSVYSTCQWQPNEIVTGNRNNENNIGFQSPNTINEVVGYESKYEKCEWQPNEIVYNGL